MASKKFIVSSVDELESRLIENIKFPLELCEESGRPLFTPSIGSDDKAYNLNTLYNLVSNRKTLGTDGRPLKIKSGMDSEKKQEMSLFLSFYGVDYDHLIDDIDSFERVELTITYPLPRVEHGISIDENFRNPISTCLCIDNSGSMNTECNSAEGNFTRLQLVKYACILVIMASKEGDEISIVKFSDRASVVSDWITITSADTRNTLITIVKSIETEGCTNIGDAIIKSFELVQTKKNLEHTVHLFTDGENTAGYLTRIEAFRRTGANGKNLAIYGFSSACDVRDLTSISKDVTMYFIPDYSMLLTNFVNGFANTCYKEPIILSENDERVRKAAIQLLSYLVKGDVTFQEKLGLLNEFGRSLNSYEQSSFIEGLKLDFLYNDESSKGQVEKAIKAEYFPSWGHRFLLSYISSLYNMNCTNYKDNAPSLFITSHRQEVIDECEDIISSVRITDHFTPSMVVINAYPVSSSGLISYPVAPQLYNRGGDSITGCSMIITKDGAMRVDEITSDTLIKTDRGFSKVKFLVRMDHDGPVYKIGTSLKLTEYHPYRIGNEDYFPIDRSDGTCYYKGYLYDLILENKRNAYFSNCGHDHILVSCWGVNSSSDEDEISSIGNTIFSHPFFNSEKIVDEMYDLAQDQKAEFLIDLYHCPKFRDPESTLIIGHDLEAIKEITRINRILDINKEGNKFSNVTLPISFSSLSLFPQITSMLEIFYGLAPSETKSIDVAYSFSNLHVSDYAETGNMLDYNKMRTPSPKNNSNIKCPGAPIKKTKRIEYEQDIWV